jgi:hypothetical protein
VFLDVFRKVTAKLNETRVHRRNFVSALAPFAKGIYAIDDTTLDALTRKTAVLQKHPKGAIKTLGGRLGCAMDVATGAYAEVLYDADAAANEKTHILPLLVLLPLQSLILMDLGYFSFPLFDAITSAGRFFVTRLRAKTSTVTLQVLANRSHYRDQIVQLGKWRSDRTSNPVRVVELLIDGIWYRYVTNVLSPETLPAANIWALYAQRWTIEMSFAAVKRALGMAYLHPCHQNGILIQIWCTLTVYQILQDLRLEIAATQGWSEDEVSWYNLMQRIAWYAMKSAQIGGTLRQWLIDEASDLSLKKRGVRNRRRKELPVEVLEDLDGPVVMPDLAQLSTRKARQGKPAPRTMESALVLAGLQNPPVELRNK